MIRRDLVSYGPAVLQMFMPPIAISLRSRSIGWGLLLWSVVQIGYLSPPVFAQERPFLVATEASRLLMEEGRRSLLDFRIGEGEAAFYRLARQPGGAVAAYHNLTAASLLKAVMADDPVEHEAFWARSDSTLALLKKAPEGKWRMYLYAENALQRMVVHAKEENYIHAALAARTAYGRTEEVIRRYPDFYEPYKGMGLLQVAIGSLPRTYRNLLSFFGFPGNMDKGLRDLQLAAERSTYSREEASLGLALTDAFLFSEPEKANVRLKVLYETRSDSPLFAFFYGFLLLRERNAKLAERVLTKAAHADGRLGLLYIDYVDYWLADALFRQNRFLEAERYYRRYLSRHDGPELRAICRLGLGKALEMQGKRMEAIVQYRGVEGSRAFDDDLVAEREAQHRLEHPISPVQRKLVLGGNAFDSGRYDEAESILTALWTAQGLTPNDRAEVAYRLGRVYQVTDKPERALEYYGRSVRQAQDSLARWAPWSHYYIGQIYDRQGKKDLAERAYRAALAYEEAFDYYQSLDQNAKAALKRLG